MDNVNKRNSFTQLKTKIKSYKWTDHTLTIKTTWTMYIGENSFVQKHNMFKHLMKNENGNRYSFIKTKGR